MSFFKASKKAEDLKQSGSSHITSSGMYPVTLLAPMVNVSDNGATSIDMFLEHDGQKQVMYGNLRITNNDGGTNKIGNKVFNQLIVIADLDDIADPVEHELPIGKKEALKSAAVLEDLADVEVIMRVQMEYSAYKGNIQEKKVIKAFFRLEDKASAEEIVNESKVGEAYEKEMKYVNHVTYKDDLTEELIQVWITAKRPKGTAGKSSGASSKPKKTPGFGDKKRSFPKADEDE